MSITFEKLNKIVKDGHIISVSAELKACGREILEYERGMSEDLALERHELEHSPFVCPEDVDNMVAEVEARMNKKLSSLYAESDEVFNRFVALIGDEDSARMLSALNLSCIHVQKAIEALADARGDDVVSRADVRRLDHVSTRKFRESLRKKYVVGNANDNEFFTGIYAVKEVLDAVGVERSAWRRFMDAIVRYIWTKRHETASMVLSAAAKDDETFWEQVGDIHYIIHHRYVYEG